VDISEATAVVLVGIALRIARVLPGLGVLTRKTER